MQSRVDTNLKIVGKSNKLIQLISPISALGLITFFSDKDYKPYALSSASSVLYG